MEDNLQTLKPGVSVIVTESLNFVVPTRRRFGSNPNPGGSGDPAEMRGFHNPGGRRFQGSAQFRALALHGETFQVHYVCCLGIGGNVGAQKYQMS